MNSFWVIMNSDLGDFLKDENHYVKNLLEAKRFRFFLIAYIYAIKNCDEFENIEFRKAKRIKVK